MINNDVLKGRIMLYGVAVVWGSGFLAADIALSAGIDAFYMMMLRFTIASVILLIFTFHKIKEHLKNTLVGGVILGFLLFLGFAFQTVGLKYTTPSNNAFLTSVNVVIAPILIFIGTRRKMKLRVYVSSVLMLVGIYILTEIKSFETFNIGDLLSLICAFFFALHIILVGYYTQKPQTNILALINWQMFTAAIFSIIAASVTQQVDFSIIFTNSIFSVLYLALFSTLFAFSLQTIGQKFVKQTEATIILSTESLFAASFSLLFAAEQFRMSLVIGGIIIFIANLLIEGEWSWFFNKIKVTKTST